jgi:flavin reductase (DIM6/NTAB) family NADH-FMN oxidoreductase RutF
MVETISNDAFREILSRFASGVTVVAVNGRGGPVGFTATGFTSVSLEPPLILVCIDKDASVYDAVVEAACFGISVLDAEQASIARRFAQSDIDRFEGVAFRVAKETQVPLIEGALAHLECRRQSLQDVGDHSVIVGAVVGGFAGSGRPLVHYGRRLGTFVAATSDPATSR